MAGNDGTTGSTGARARQADGFFDGSMYVIDVQGWPRELIFPNDPILDAVDAPTGARLRVQPIHPHDRRPLPPVDPAQAPVELTSFAMKHSGNKTLQAPKRSWKVELGDGGRIGGMSTLNLKAMYNDPSQMREALAWKLFADAEVPASRHTYARFGIDDVYLGLFSVIENVDKHFLSSRFDGRDRGTLIKVYCGDIGCGTLQHRVGTDGDDSGRQYQAPGDDPTYRVKSWSDAPGAESLDDLAHFVRVVNGVDLPGGDEKFATDRFAQAVREVFDVEPFLRWAGVNVLIGAWDNYFATPANYFLYNGGRGAGSGDLLGEPYFTWIPWDYDNSFGLDYFGTRWQDTALLDWPSNTGRYWSHGGQDRGGRSSIPLVTNLLANQAFRRYYLDHLEHLLDTVFTTPAIDAAIGITDPGTGVPSVPATGGGLWDRVSRSAYLESSTPWGSPETRRQYSNDEVYRGGFAQYELRHGETFALGIHHYVRMRYDSARAQLAVLRRQDPAGSSGATFGHPADDLRRSA